MKMLRNKTYHSYNRIFAFAHFEGEKKELKIVPGTIWPGSHTKFLVKLHTIGI